MATACQRVYRIITVWAAAVSPDEHCILAYHYLFGTPDNP